MKNFFSFQYVLTRITLCLLLVSFALLAQAREPKKLDWRDQNHFVFAGIQGMRPGVTWRAQLTNRDSVLTLVFIKSKWGIDQRIEMTPMKIPLGLHFKNKKARKKTPLWKESVLHYLASRNITLKPQALIFDQDIQLPQAGQTHSTLWLKQLGDDHLVLVMQSGKAADLDRERSAWQHFINSIGHAQ